MYITEDKTDYDRSAAERDAEEAVDNVIQHFANEFAVLRSTYPEAFEKAKKILSPKILAKLHE